MGLGVMEFERFQTRMGLAVEANVEEMDLVGLECLGGLGNTVSS
jgi:hypothetical protein